MDKEEASKLRDILKETKLKTRTEKYVVGFCEKLGQLMAEMPCVEISDDDIKEFYPKYSPDHLTEAERTWIATGIWDKDALKGF